LQFAVAFPGAEKRGVSALEGLAITVSPGTYIEWTTL